MSPTLRSLACASLLATPSLPRAGSGKSSPLLLRYNLRRLNKIKPSHGQILAVSELHERRTAAVRTYGIALKYQSRTTIHNMYKEYRDVSLNGAVS